MKGAVFSFVLSAVPGVLASTCSVQQDTAMSADFYSNTKISQSDCCDLCASDSRCRTAVYSPQGECHLHDAKDSAHPFGDHGWMLMSFAPAEKNIVELAESVKDLSTLVSAVVAADLADTLSSPGSFTVFAPTNAAFASLPAGTVDSLMKPENKAQLVDILTYHHVLPEQVLAKDIQPTQAVVTVEGKALQVQKSGGAVTVGPSSSDLKKVTSADNIASNGVVHIIDGVLLPPQLPNIVKLAESVKDLSTLVSALVAADLVDTLVSPGPFTVFAPTNAAFAALPDGTVDSLMKPENKAQLVDILTYHVLPAQVFAKDLDLFQAVKTVEGKSLHVQKWGGVVRVGPSLESKDLKQVTAADNAASNGVVHIIDGVLLPSAASEVADAIVV